MNLKGFINWMKKLLMNLENRNGDWPLTIHHFDIISTTTGNQSNAPTSHHYYQYKAQLTEWIVAWCKNWQQNGKIETWFPVKRQE